MATTSSDPSTPGEGRGTASEVVSEDMKKLVAGRIAHDLKAENTCDARQLLKLFLRRCRKAGEDKDDDTLLNECLDAVVNLCEDVTLTRNLRPYCNEVKEEQSRYAPLIRAFDYALGKLKDLKTLPLRAPSELDVMFHWNDPAVISDKLPSHPELAESLRKSDTAMVSFDVVQRAAGNPKGKRYKSNFVGVQDKPNNDFICSYDTNFQKDIPAMEYDTSTEIDAHVNAGTSDEDVVASNSQISSTIATDSRLNPIANSATTSGPKIPKKRRSTKQKVSSVFDDDGKPVKRVGPMVQCALYGAEMLSRGPDATHAMVLSIKDGVIWMWWYDRQGAIQSSGIDFLEDLPYFLVLLAAFQRFTLPEWGFDGTLFPAATQHNTAVVKSPIPERQHMTSFNITFSDANGNEVVATVDPSDIVFDRFSLLGRATRLIGATSPSRPNERLVLKISWPEVSRINEATIITQAYGRGKGDPLIEDHLPDLIGWQDLGPSTAFIRDALGIPSRKVMGRSGPRVLRVMLLSRLIPIEKLSGPEFMKAWIDCYRCHFRLWLHGIEHGDISVWNLMYNPTTKAGVLNDFDLSIVREEGKVHTPSGKGRTGTVPFMALDLLCDDFFDGKITRQYSHENESFIWVLAWQLLKRESVKHWETGDYDVCRMEKIVSLDRLKQLPQLLKPTTHCSLLVTIFGLLLWS